MADYPTSTTYLMRELMATGAIVPDRAGTIRFAFDVEPIGLDEYEKFEKEIKELEEEIGKLEARGRDAQAQKEALEKKQRQFDLKQKEWWTNIFSIGIDTQDACSRQQALQAFFDSLRAASKRLDIDIAASRARLWNPLLQPAMMAA